MALIAKPAGKPFFLQLPFLPGPMSATPPPPGESPSQQIMLNLGVKPDAAAAPAVNKE